MANNTNTITIVGNITREPELRFTPSGAANVRFGVAVNRSWQDRASGEWKEETSFFDVVAWREMAENISESLPKGARVIVTGRLEQRSYDDREGNKRYVFEIIADEVGPSLRFATAQVNRNERKGGGDFAPRGGGAPQNETVPAAAPVSNYDEYGEEPF